MEVKLSHYRPGQALWVPGRSGSQISIQKAHEGGNVVSPRNRPSLPTGKYCLYSFLSGAKCGQKNYVIEKFQIRTLDFPACSAAPNQLRHPVYLAWDTQGFTSILSCAEKWEVCRPAVYCAELRRTLLLCFLALIIMVNVTGLFFIMDPV